MQRLMTRPMFLVLATLLLVGTACGPNPPGKLPVSSPVYSFQKPDAEDFEVEEDEDLDDDTTPPDGEE